MTDEQGGLEGMEGLGGMGGLGGLGGLDMGALLEQAQQMQQQLVAAQEELSATEITGTVGGVTVTVNGTGELVAVELSAAATGDLGDDEARADLGDLVVAAYRDAKSRSDALAAERIGPLAGGLGGFGV